MLCQICKKNPATVHVQEIINGEKRIMHFCAECAEKKSMLEPFLKGMTLAGLLQKMEEMEKEAQNSKQTSHVHGEEQEEDQDDSLAPVCPDCAWTLQQLKKTGRMGCPSCYQVFFPFIKKELAGIHRGLHFCGSEPPEPPKKKNVKRCKSAAQIRDEIAMLKKGMEESIRREEYEQAAELRDKIGILERTLSEKEGA